jgi:hypothetical protein
VRDRTSRTFIAVSLCRETVAVAYAKLRAMRTLEELQRDDTPKQTDEDGGGVKEEGAVEMVSDYERQRHARMEENNRILMMTGILEASEEMIEQSTPSQHLGSGGSEKKRKRDEQSDADDEEVMKRQMRLRGAKEDLGNPSQDHRMDDGSEGGGDRSSGLPPSGQLSRGEGQVRPEGERERALSDVDTPVKVKSPLPCCTNAPWLWCSRSSFARKAALPSLAAVWRD